MRSTVIFADKLLQSGFSLATKAGLSIAVDDMLIPGQKPSILEHAEEEVKEIEQQFASGLLLMVKDTTKWLIFGVALVTRLERQ